MSTKKTTKMERPRRKRVTFRFEAGPDSDVRLAGSFNNWAVDAQRLTRQDGKSIYSATLLLSPGRHEYKFVVNGVWNVDPSAPDRALNEYGTLNSVIMV